MLYCAVRSIRDSFLLKVVIRIAIISSSNNWRGGNERVGEEAIAPERNFFFFGGGGRENGKYLMWRSAKLWFL